MPTLYKLSTGEALNIGSTVTRTTPNKRGNHPTANIAGFCSKKSGLILLRFDNGGDGNTRPTLASLYDIGIDWGDNHDPQ